MASDTFARIGDIKGESADSKHKDEIEVLSFSWNIKQTIVTDGGGGGGSAGKVQHSDFTIAKHVDKASPLLMMAVCTGQHFPDAMFTVAEPQGGGGGQAFRGGKAQLEYLKIKFTDVLITSFQNGGGGTDQPMDQVSLNYSKVDIHVRDNKGNWTSGESCDSNKD